MKFRVGDHVCMNDKYRFHFNKTSNTGVYKIIQIGGGNLDDDTITLSNKELTKEY